MKIYIRNPNLENHYEQQYLSSPENGNRGYRNMFGQDFRILAGIHLSRISTIQISML